MTGVECYHEPVRCAYNAIRSEALPLDSETALWMAVKAVNDSVGPNGLIPTLFVYGTLPRLGFSTDPPSPSMYERARAFRKASKEVSEYFARLQVSSALRTQTGPRVHDAHNVPIDGHILLYRPITRKWEGPYSLLFKDNEDFTILMDHGLSKFRNTSLKPYRPPMDTTIRTKPNPTEPANEAPIILSCIGNTCPLTLPIIVSQPPVNDCTIFETSRSNEFSQLVDWGVSDIVQIPETKGFRLFGSRFFDQVKNEGLPNAFGKSRLVVQVFSDKSHKLLTYAPTVLRASQRILPSFAAIFSSLHNFTRDVRQAYTQSETKLSITVFIQPPSSLGIPSDHVLWVLRHLYGLAESGVHWFKTYHQRHINCM